MFRGKKERVVDNCRRKGKIQLMLLQPYPESGKPFLRRTLRLETSFKKSAAVTIVFAFTSFKARRDNFMGVCVMFCSRRSFSRSFCNILLPRNYRQTAVWTELQGVPRKTCPTH
jgi:hypothetical protein